MSNSSRPYELQHARLPCPSLSPGICSTHAHWISDAIQPSHPLSPPSSFALKLSQHLGLPMSWLFASKVRVQSFGALASASVPPINIQAWLPSGLTGFISLLNWRSMMRPNILLLLFRCSVVSSSFATPWTVAHKAPLSMGFPRQEYWSGWPVPSAEDLPDPGAEPASPVLPGRFFTPESPGDVFNAEFQDPLW